MRRGARKAATIYLRIARFCGLVDARVVVARWFLGLRLFRQKLLQIRTSVQDRVVVVPSETCRDVTPLAGGPAKQVDGTSGIAFVQFRFDHDLRGGEGKDRGQVGEAFAIHVLVLPQLIGLSDAPGDVADAYQ